MLTNDKIIFATPTILQRKIIFIDIARFDLIHVGVYFVESGFFIFYINTPTMDEFFDASPQTGFTIYSNKKLVRNRELNAQERIILMIMLSHAQTWKLSLKNISFDACMSKNTAAKYINNLIKKGYVYRIRLRDNKGRLTISKYYYSWDKESLQNKIKSLKTASINFSDLSSTKNCDLDNKPNTKNCDLDKSTENEHVNPSTKNCDLDKSPENEHVNPSTKNCDLDKSYENKDVEQNIPSTKYCDTIKDNNKNKKENKIKGFSFFYWFNVLSKINFNDVSRDEKNKGYFLLLELGFNQDIAEIMIKNHDIKDKYIRAYKNLRHCHFSEYEAIKYINHPEITQQVFKWKHQHLGKTGSYSWEDGEKSYLKGGFKKLLRNLGITDHNDNII